MMSPISVHFWLLFRVLPLEYDIIWKVSVVEEVVAQRFVPSAHVKGRSNSAQQPRCFVTRDENMPRPIEK